MDLQPDTIRMFKHLQRCYDIREVLFPSKRSERAINNSNIHYYEFLLEEHCLLHYQTPWFRVYTYWRVHVEVPNSRLDY